MQHRLYLCDEGLLVRGDAELLQPRHLCVDDQVINESL